MKRRCLSSQPPKLQRLTRVALLVIPLLLLQSVAIQATLAASGGPLTPIRHVVFIMLENHSFDNVSGSIPR